MHYYLVWVSSPQFQSTKPLTYSYKGILNNGAIVKVPIRDKLVIALIDSETDKPDFDTKDITGTIMESELPKSNLELFKWLMGYYPATSSSQLQLFLPNNLLQLKDTDRANKNYHNKKVSINLPDLTEEQKIVINKIEKSDLKTVLIHGDTGTGKTRVYTELIKKIINMNKSILVLTPEIGLTPQLIKTLEESFPDRTVIMHSSLTDKVRRENWLRILNSEEALIIVGPRSALFSPLNNLGLIIMDEAHEASYKQEQSPYYQTSRVAAKLAEINNSKLIMGTATPLISDYFVLDSKKMLITRMVKPAVSNFKINSVSEIETVDLTNRTMFSKSVWLSDKLINSITKSLSDHEQSIVFLNRRGTAQVILCNNCGWQAICPNCDTSLTYHADSHKMLCHTCNYKQDIPSSCPVCNNTDIIFRGAGTKAIEEELKKIFRTAKISRFDRDNKKMDSLEQNYNKLISGEIDIAVGTQIITKGLDLPNLSTVGIVMADSGLFFPDYMSEERTFQNLMQVIGRVGRGHIAGRVIVQTYHPNSIALKSAINKDYDEIYKQQIKERKKYLYPPFVYILKIIAKRSTRENAETACIKIIDRINSLGLKIQINGPAPAFYEKQNGKYIWQIIVKSTEREYLLKIIELLPGNYNYDIDPASLL